MSTYCNRDYEAKVGKILEVFFENWVGFFLREESWGIFTKYNRDGVFNKNILSRGGNWETTSPSKPLNTLPNML